MIMGKKQNCFFDPMGCVKCTEDTLLVGLLKSHKFKRRNIWVQLSTLSWIFAVGGAGIKTRQTYRADVYLKIWCTDLGQDT